MSVAVTISFLESAFQLDKKTRKSIMDAISQLDSNQEIFALRCHRIDKMKCDPTFWSARVNDDKIKDPEVFEKAYNYIEMYY